MNKGVEKILCSLVFSMLLAFSAAPSAYAEELTSPKYPGRPNVAWDVSLIEVVVVHVLNTTPYDMQIESTNGKVDSDFKDFYTVNSVYPQEKGTSVSPTAVTPSGIPYKIPAKSGASFIVSWLDTASSGGKQFNADEVYPDLNITYTMKQVVSNWPAQNCPNPTTGDVKILLDFNRVKQQQKSLKGDIFQLIVSGAAFVVDAAEFVVEPNPLSFMGYLISAEEIGSTAKEIAERSSSSNQAYFSAYVLPKGNSTTDNFPAAYAPPNKGYSSNDQAAPYDGLYSQHGPNGGGCPQAYIIPAVMVQRETGPDQGKLDGHLPVVFVTLATSVDWNSAMMSLNQPTMQASSAGYKITQYLNREGKKGHVAFIKLARTLNHNELVLLDGAYKAIEQKKALSREQEALLEVFAEALEKHATSLPTMKNPPAHNK